MKIDMNTKFIFALWRTILPLSSKLSSSLLKNPTTQVIEA